MSSRSSSRTRKKNSEEALQEIVVFIHDEREDEPDDLYEVCNEEELASHFRNRAI